MYRNKRYFTMRSQSRRNDRREESRDRGRKGKTKRGRPRTVAPQNLVGVNKDV